MPDGRAGIGKYINILLRKLIDHKSQMNLNLNKDAEIFYDGRAIDISDLEKKYRGCYVYAMILPG